MKLEEIRPLKPIRYPKTFIVHNIQPGTVPPKVGEFYLQDDGKVYQQPDGSIEVLRVIGEYYFVSNTLVMNVSPFK